MLTNCGGAPIKTTGVFISENAGFAYLRLL